MGVLILLRPAKVPVPTLWWALACAFLLAASAAFLPADWFPTPAWRQNLQTLGVHTGAMVVIQSQMALETLVLFAITLFTGLWMAGHRASPAQLRACALAFTLGVAVYALLARITQGSPWFPGLSVTGDNFGFFPNRNHTATYLAMGTVCGLGLLVQSLRDKRFVILALALAATAVCLWAIAFWSISRAGVVLISIGAVGWIGLIGTRYLGRHGLWAIALIGLTAGGLFLLSESRVRERLEDTIGKASMLVYEDKTEPAQDKQALDPNRSLDFRINIFRDTAGLIREFPWTGVGAGQFAYIFPQYRVESAVANDKDCVHPESDWLWLAAESGIPATLILLALVTLALVTSLRGIRKGRDRALRAGCLVAAMLVPIHGLFDMPAHRLTLAWSAALLFALSLQPIAVAPAAARLRLWGSRLLACGLIAASALLARAEWFGGPQPAVTSARHAVARAVELHRQDTILWNAAEERGEEYDPDPAEDKLEHALVILERAAATAPLDRRLRRHQAWLGFYFDDKYDFIDHTFAVDRALDPTWVEGPMRQAAAWATIDPARTIAIWQVALERARMLDRIAPDTIWSEARNRDRIRRFAQDHPDLQTVFGDTPE